MVGGLNLRPVASDRPAPSAGAGGVSAPAGARGPGMGDAKVDTRSREDPVEQVYDARIRGVCLISTRAGGRMHLHGGCWVTAASHQPPRLLVAFPKEFEGADIVQKGGDFAVSLVADDQVGLNDALFSGRQSLDALGRHRWLRAPSGCPVLRDGVGYFDCRLAEAVDLGDFLLAVGDLRAAAILWPDKRNLTVNAIQRRDTGGQPILPLHGFDDDGGDLAAAPVEGADARVLEAVYGRRQWGLFLVTAHAGGVTHLHVGCWAIQCSHQPPRMLVCIDRHLPAADLVRASGRFALSLLAEDQLPVAVRVVGGATVPEALTGVRFRSLGEGLPVLDDAVAHFLCSVEGEFNAGADHAGFYGPVLDFGWGRRDAPQLRDDQLMAAWGATNGG